MRTDRRTRRKHARGFTLVEAMVTLLVIGFGLLAVAGFQLTLARGADISKQRAEATRIAQRDMEALRAYTAKAPASGVATSYAGSIVTQAETPVVPASGATTNTTFRLSRTVQTFDEHKTLEVRVRWQDRNLQWEEVNLTSVISGYEPTEVTLLATGAGSPKYRRPKNRDINIPYPSVRMQGGKSGFTPPGSSGFYFVFDDVTGNVLAKCTDLTANPLVQDGAACANNMNGFLLAGYVRFKTGDLVPGNSNQAQAIADAVANSNDPTLPLAANYSGPANVQPLSIVTSATGSTFAPSAYECYSQRRVDLTDGTSAVDTGQNQVWSRYIAYVCIITPQTVGTDTAWSGEVKLVSDGSWIIGDGTILSTDWKVCRYSADYDGNGLSNNEHPRYYRKVTGSMDNQNFLVIWARRALNASGGPNQCPTDGAATPLTGDFTNSNTVAHQPTGTLSTGEPSSATTILPMF